MPEADAAASPALAAALAALTPWPEDGSRADGPVAVDATDRLLLDEAAALLAGAGPQDVAVIGDRFGALSLGALALGAGRVRLHTDAVTAERAVLANQAASPAPDAVGGLRVLDHLGPALAQGARVVLLQLPRSLSELQEVAELVAREGADGVTLLAGGRVKHMTHAMNDVLGACFAHVRATLARGKSRVLVASGPLPQARSAPPSYPVTARLRDAELLAAARLPADGAVTVVAHGGVFAGATLDLGTRALLRTAGQWPAAADAVDLGCGTGLLAAVLALRDGGARVVATDRSAAATTSAHATAQANGVGERVAVLRDDAGAGLADASADLVVCNPPFHDRAALSTDAAHRMFATAARVLRPGGELWCVYNSALRHRGALERTIGPTTQAARDPRFTVTRTVRR
ncbi:class I SAM-dependent methyltransferase [Xylanimonas ulmi]|uniref:16S rRNA (Guanine1207-N2)-methyltransferase n=1 Tax=Xylanimonas ulmi TaxID=228973 RepID=A0A4Q7LXT6_9MICO|nr:methyltransferase [Xylanibacterium ulmi]RZS59866.1 16S rRNA (guanine1207-N2)-methyltransferase [Xylanibacterium ulmi]